MDFNITGTPYSVPNQSWNISISWYPFAEHPIGGFTPHLFTFKEHVEASRQGPQSCGFAGDMSRMTTEK